MLPAKTPELAYPVSIAEDGTRRAVTMTQKGNMDIPPTFKPMRTSTV